VDSDIQFTELMEQKVLWEEWYTYRFSERNVGVLSPDERRLLDMDPNKLLDPTLFAYLRRQTRD
jgi:hypothetical protein